MRRRLLVLGAALGLAGLGLATSLRSLGAKALGGPARRTGPLPPGSIYALDSLWTNDHGATFRLAELAGTYLVVALIFTRCPSVCPTLVRQLRVSAQNLPEPVRAQVRFALFSIDPEHDSVAALQAYRAELALDQEHFTLARASADAVRELGATLGFAFSAEAGGLPTHSKLVTLLDRVGKPMLARADLSADPELLLHALQRALGAEGPS